MKDHSNLMRVQLTEIKRLISKTEKSIKKLDKLPQGKLSIKSSHGYAQYYYQAPSSSVKKYLPISEKNKYAHLTQLEYEKNVLKQLQKQEKALDQFLSCYDVNSIARVYEKVCKAKQDLITPIEPTDQELAKAWMQEHPGMQNPFPEPGKYLTERGELVRSKSEKILADEFYKNGVPYQYEPLLILNDYQTFYPDFILLNLKERKSQYWEHLGLLDDPEYAKNQFLKIQAYERNGITLGDNLILSMETTEDSLDISFIREKIRKIFF